MRTKLIAALALTLGLAPGAGAQTVVSSDITTNTTWSGTIVLQQPIFVRDGARLTIQGGTIVRGQPRTGIVLSAAEAPGALIVSQTGTINANGQGNPIIFTTAATDNDGNNIPDDTNGDGFKDTWEPGDTFYDDNPAGAPLAPLDAAGNANLALWGGVVILGNAPTNLADKCLGGGANYGKCTIEGLAIPGFDIADSTYGGVEPHDNSGIFRFVSIRHGGDEISEANELNGLSLGAVGDATTIENVEVYSNFDDGFEWFGGTVGGRNLAVFFAGDDQFDLDEGYTGVNQFLFAVMPYFNENDGGNFGYSSGDKAGEFDGDNYDVENNLQDFNVNVRENAQRSVSEDTPWPLSNPYLWNMTVIASDPPVLSVPPTSNNSTNRGIQFRNGFAGSVLNSIIIGTGGETGIEVDTAAVGVPGHTALDHANAGLTNLVCSTLANGAALAAQETTVVNNGNALALVLPGFPSANASANVVNNVRTNDSAAAVFNGLVNSDPSFTLTGNGQGKLDPSLKVTKLNPRVLAGAGTIGCPQPRWELGGLNPGATFRGAFPTGGNLWTTGWSVMNAGGILAQ